MKLNVWNRVRIVALYHFQKFCKRTALQPELNYIIIKISALTLTFFIYLFIWPNGDKDCLGRMLVCLFGVFFTQKYALTLTSEGGKSFMVSVTLIGRKNKWRGACPTQGIAMTWSLTTLIESRTPYRLEESE